MYRKLHKGFSEGSILQNYVFFNVLAPQTTQYDLRRLIEIKFDKLLKLHRHVNSDTLHTNSTRKATNKINLIRKYYF